MKIITQEISFPFIKEKGIKLFIKRIDLNHEYISGNKLYKLKYNLIDAKRQGAKSILTFGGAYSNHILATAFLANEYGFYSIGVIRGEEHLPFNPTLKFALAQGMKVHYMNRNEYRLKHTIDVLEKLKDQFGDFYLIPEGGTNKLGIRGASEIIDKNDNQDYVCCAVGTGGTITGIINSSNESQNVIGFPVVNKFTELEEDILRWTKRNNYILINDYAFNGYAKFTDELINFINSFYKSQNIPLDAIYTGKMMMGIFDLIKKDYFPKGSSILAIHTGGLQGNKGMNERFAYGLPTN